MQRVKIKTKNKWDNVTPLQIKIGNILKIIGFLIFLSVWTPAFVYTISEMIKFWS